MKLYDFTAGPHPRRVRIFLAEKGVDVPLEQVNIMTQENRTDAFLAKNPFGGLPILELDDGTCIAESVSICRYFDETHTENPLFGKTPKQKAVIDMWLRRVELQLMVHIGMVWIHGHELNAGSLNQIPEAAEQSRARCAVNYKIFDTELATREFMAGDEYSVVDAIALATIDFASFVDAGFDDSLSNLKRWHEAMSARPSAQA
jgi:glutathione S-transferase